MAMTADGTRDSQLYEEIRDLIVAPVAASTSSPIQCPKVMKPAGEPSEPYQVTLCSAYGVSLY